MSSSIVRVAVAATVLSFSALTLAKDMPTAKPESVGLSSERLARLDASIHAYVDAGRTPGVVTVIARHGKVVHVDAYGKADLESGRASRTDDVFRMYSMTKPITSVALLTLYEQGKFQLTDPLSKYFPRVAEMKVFAGNAQGPSGPGPGAGGPLFESQKRPITIQDVFRHGAGFSYGFGATGVDKQYADANLLSKSLTDLMERLPDLPLLYQPGDRWVYSVAHDVQAALVEKLSGQKFDDYVREKIFKPLGMRNSYFKMSADVKSRVPPEYVTGRDGKLAKNPSPLAQSYGDIALGGYSISTTAQDYAKFAQMLLNGGQLDGARVLSPKTVKLMASNHLTPTAMAAGGVSPGTGYGLGVSVLVDPVAKGNLGSVGEFGWSGAASTHVLIDPEEDLVAVYCTQLFGGDLALRAEFATMLYQSIVAK
ncbi:MAG: serine hydrolase domain-containing protein [Steroidobacteraceae bacterium]